MVLVKDKQIRPSLQELHPPKFMYVHRTAVTTVSAVRVNPTDTVHRVKRHYQAK